jgi:hypothetical protein
MNDAGHHAELKLAFRVVAGDTPPTGGLPFHHYGQFGPGHLDKRCLLQTETWVDREGVANPLTSMSRKYRANVLALLRHQSPRWALDAYTVEVALTITGVIPPAQASREITALRSLPPGWVDHTPLGLELHHLNGTQPDPLPPSPPRITADESDSPQTLRNEDTGLWTVTTHSHSQYMLDLGRRRVRRTPGLPTDGEKPATRLAGDGEWTRLTALVDCEVGSSLLILDELNDVDCFKLSTAICTIRRTPATATAP